MTPATRHPHPTAKAPAELPAEYYAQYVEAANTHWWFKGRERVLRTIVGAHVSLPPQAVVVDVGSGPGGPTRALFPSQRIVAVDLSARVLGAYTDATAGFVADASRLPLKAGSVDAICAFDVLEHLQDDARAVRGWHEVLAPRGSLIVTVPAYEALWSDSDEVDRHYRRYRRRNLTSCLRSAGFTIVRASYFNSLLLPGVAIAKWVARAIGTRRRANRRNAELDIRVPGLIEKGIVLAFAAEARWLQKRDLPLGVSIVAVARR